MAAMTGTDAANGELTGYGGHQGVVRPPLHPDELLGHNFDPNDWDFVLSMVPERTPPRAALPWDEWQAESAQVLAEAQRRRS